MLIVQGFFKALWMRELEPGVLGGKGGAEGLGIISYHIILYHGM